MYSGFAQRFTLLLLEEGEDYVSDYNAYCYAPGILTDLGQAPSQIQEASFTLPGPGQRVHGKLRLCTKSIFFDADDASVPILRCEPMLSTHSPVLPRPATHCPPALPTSFQQRYSALPRACAYLLQPAGSRSPASWAATVSGRRSCTSRPHSTPPVRPTSSTGRTSTRPCHARRRCSFSWSLPAWTR